MPIQFRKKIDPSIHPRKPSSQHFHEISRRASGKIADSPAETEKQERPNVLIKREVSDGVMGDDKFLDNIACAEGVFDGFRHSCTLVSDLSNIEPWLNK